MRLPLSPLMSSATPASPDVIVIGSGIGGLCCASLAARYGLSVTLLESHSIPGGCAHSFDRNGFTFDSGPSLWAGLSRPSVNPLRQVLDAVGESDSIDWVTYDGWGMVIPEGDFFFKTGDAASWEATLAKFGGERAIKEWQQLIDYADPVIRASGATPPAVLRSDPFVLLPLLRVAGGLLQAGPHARYLNGPFSLLMEAAGLPTDGPIASKSFVAAWLDYLAFALSGLDAKGTLGAAVAYTLGDLYKPGATLDYPVGGSGAVIEALVRGLSKHGGTLRTSAHVEEIVIEDGRACGVRLKSGEVLRANKGVVSNADVWRTTAMLPPAYRPTPRPGGGGALNSKLSMTPSFMHLHLGIRADPPLPEGVGIHYSVLLDSFEDIEADRNMVIISIPTLLDPALAPENCHVVHAYYAANEPYDDWEGLSRSSDEYKQLKAERAEPMWRALEKIIPDVRERVVTELVASPLTHERFLRRTRGSYGPPLFHGSETIPYAGTPVPGLLHCGDSTFPGIGVPSAAASGMNAANTLASPWQQIELMNELDEKGCLTP